MDPHPVNGSAQISGLSKSLTAAGRCALAVPVGIVARDERAEQQIVISVRDKGGTRARWRILTGPELYLDAGRFLGTGQGAHTMRVTQRAQLVPETPSTSLKSPRRCGLPAEMVPVEPSRSIV